MAGAGPTMLLREENGCCSRRQSSSSAGVSVGSGSGGAVGQRHLAGRGRRVARMEKGTALPSSPRASGSAARAAGDCSSMGVQPTLGV